MAKKIVNHAVPSITESEATTKDKVSSARSHITALSNSPDFPAAIDVQAAAAAWSVETDQLDADEKNIKDLKEKLAALQAKQLGTLRRWTARRRGLLAAVATFCDGSKDQVLAFGFAVKSRGEHVTAIIPQGLRARRSKIVGMATAAWKPQPGGQGFMVQYAVDTANPNTYSPPISCSKATFKLVGQTLGATIYFRVSALDSTLPTGQTDYTPWVAVTVSS